MGKQQKIIEANHNQILVWQKEHRPTDWIAKELKVSRTLLKSVYPDYKGNQGGHSKYVEIEYNLNPFRCKGCNIILNWKSRKQKFCTQSCSASYNNKIKQRSAWTKNQKKQHSIRVKKLWAKNVYSGCKPRLETRACVICNKQYSVTPWKVKRTCSKECCRMLLSKISKNNPNCGGETNYKKFLYKNINMDSSWEVELAKYLDSKNIEWIRSRKLLLYWTDVSGVKRRYYPDFYLPKLNIYLDPKNEFKLKLDKEKLEKVIKENNIVLLVGSLKEIIKNLEGHGTAQRGRLICNE